MVERISSKTNAFPKGKDRHDEPFVIASDGKERRDLEWTRESNASIALLVDVPRNPNPIVS